MRLRVTLMFAVFMCGWLWLDARAQTGAPIVSGAHRFEKVTDGVFYATASGTMTVGANSPIIVTDTEAIVIDSEITPAAARALVADLKAITDKPVRYVIDSHYHYDHAFGNQVFGPDVQVIGHEKTRKRLLGNTMQEYTYLSSVEPVPARVAALRERIAKETDPQQKALLERQVANSLAYLEQVKEIKVTPPGVTLDRKMTLYRGGREIQLLYFGRGHTDTDLVVFLPKERIVCTGDLMESVISYMGDAYAAEWPATLDRLMELDFDTVMPGHGVVFKGKDRIREFQRYVREALKQATELKQAGVSAEAAAPRIDMTAFAPTFPQIRAAGIDPAAVRRIYALADHPEPVQ
jgi:cyclase